MVSGCWTCRCSGNVVHLEWHRISAPSHTYLALCISSTYPFICVLWNIISHKSAIVSQLFHWIVCAVLASDQTGGGGCRNFWLMAGWWEAQGARWTCLLVQAQYLKCKQSCGTEYLLCGSEALSGWIVSELNWIVGHPVGVHLKLEVFLVWRITHLFGAQSYSISRVFPLYPLSIFPKPAFFLSSTSFGSFHWAQFTLLPVHLQEPPRRNSVDIFSLHPARSLSSFNEVHDSWNLTSLVLQDNPFPWVFLYSFVFTPIFFFFYFFYSVSTVLSLLFYC